MRERLLLSLDIPGVSVINGKVRDEVGNDMQRFPHRSLPGWRKLSIDRFLIELIGKHIGGLKGHYGVLVSKSPGRVPEPPSKIRDSFDALHRGDDILRPTSPLFKEVGNGVIPLESICPCT